MQQIQASNDLRLEQMRQTVEEKLEKTLHSRLQTSFETVSKQLESVNKGLGEMQTVARDVGSLNKVLSNTKTRGIMGELQLGQIIEDILTPAQYEREFVTVPHSSERVEYAIKMPGQVRGEYVYLPIDSKFPLDGYYRLEEAYESGEKEEIERCRKLLLASIKQFAKDIHQKYLYPPATTNFGILLFHRRKGSIQKWSATQPSLIASEERSRSSSRGQVRFQLCWIHYRLDLRPWIFNEVQMILARSLHPSRRSSKNLEGVLEKTQRQLKHALVILMTS